MFHSLFNLPYSHYWLPLLLAAAVVGVPVYFVARTRRAVVLPEVVVEPPKDPFTEGSTGEQRTAFRRGGNPVEVLLTEDGDTENIRRGYVLDRSIGGLRLMVPYKLAPGSAFVVRPANASPMIPWVKVEVRSCVESKIQGGDFDVGCRFVKAPPYPILLLFG
jgi:hypothetical protein